MAKKLLSKYPNLIDEIIRYLKIGNFIDTACAMVGISRTSFYTWMRAGARDRRNGRKTLEAKLNEEVMKAIAYSEIRDLAIIAEAAKTQWQAAAWRLERRFPKKWGKKVEKQKEEEKNLFKVVSFNESIRPPMAKEKRQNSEE